MLEENDSESAFFFVRSTEKFDPREGYWSELPNMNVRRGSHSVAVLNEKLFCIGGYDGEKMVASVEIYDPRLNAWVMWEPMKFVRGYAAVAVLGNSLFAIGGVQDEKIIVDKVEYYKEGTGWTCSGWKAIGNRFFKGGGYVEEGGRAKAKAYLQFVSAPHRRVSSDYALLSFCSSVRISGSFNHVNLADVLTSASVFAYI